ncbi:BaeS Signal transduction histidine kinase [Pyrenophora tritici-repentis]|nr:BaeS Signal transduction histidine kinase [Pyrenophora tritici-repentis]
MATSMGALLTPPSPKSDHLPPSKSDDDYAPSSLAYDLIRYTPVPTVILDASLFVRHVADSYVNISGAGDCNSLVGRHADDVFDGNVTIPAKSHWEITNRKIVTGKGAAWNLRAVPILRYGNLRCIQMEFLDVTEEHQRQLEFEERSYQNETVQLLVATIRDYAILCLIQAATSQHGMLGPGLQGIHTAEIIGKHFSTFYSQEDRVRGKPERELKDALRDGRCEDEGWRLRKDGSRFWANVVITPVYKDNILLGYSKVTRDLTERRKAENSLIAAYEEASKSSRVLSQHES